MRKALRLTMRIALVLLIGLVIGCMVSCPGLYDSKRMALAVKHHHEAPSDATKREIQLARAADNRGIAGFEFLFATVIVVCGYAFIRLGRQHSRTEESGTAPSGGAAPGSGTSGPAGGPPSES